MDVTKIDAARHQLATAIRLYFADVDPISVHTLSTAAGEIINKICRTNGVTSMRDEMINDIVPDRRDEIGKALNRCRNFFKHAAEGKADEVLQDFSDEQNLFSIIAAVDGLLRLKAMIPEGTIFTAWLAVVDPKLFMSPPPKELVDTYFKDLEEEPRAKQKEAGRDALLLADDVAMGWRKVYGQ